MARPSIKDPLTKFRWSVRISGFERAGFTEMSAPGYRVNTRTYREGGAHLFPRQIVDTMEYKPVTLSRGVTTNKDFLNWAKGIFAVIGADTDNNDGIISRANQTTGIHTPPSSTTISALDNLELADNFREDVYIDHLNRQGDRVKTYILRKAFPIDYQVASDFSADADDSVSIERIVLAYESFEVETIDVNRNPFSVRGLVKRLIRRF